MTAENRAAIRTLPERLGPRFIDVGIAEQTLVGMAAGLALRGRIPVIHALAAFLTQRAFEFIRIDVGIPGLPVKLVGSFPGFVSEANGPTHQAIEDVALMRGIPNMKVFCPADLDDLLIGLDTVLRDPAPYYIRYNAQSPVVTHTPDFAPGRAEVLAEGRDATFLAYGVLFSECHQAAERLRKNGLSVGLVNLRTLKPVDRESPGRARPFLPAPRGRRRPLQDRRPVFHPGRDPARRRGHGRDPVPVAPRPLVQTGALPGAPGARGLHAGGPGAQGPGPARTSLRGSHAEPSPIQPPTALHRALGRPLGAGAGTHPGGHPDARQGTHAVLPGGGAQVPRARPRRAGVGRGRQRVSRFQHGAGSHHPGLLPPGGGRGHPPPARRRDHLLAHAPPGGRARGAPARGRAPCRIRAFFEDRLRRHERRGSAGARLHRARAGAVLRLPWLARLVHRRDRSGRRHPGRDRRADRHLPLQRHRFGALGARYRHRLRDPGALHLRARARRFSRGAAAALRSERRAPHLRRDVDRLPLCPRWGPGVPGGALGPVAVLQGHGQRNADLGRDRPTGRDVAPGKRRVFFYYLRRRDLVARRLDRLHPVPPRSRGHRAHRPARPVAPGWPATDHRDARARLCLGHGVSVPDAGQFRYPGGRSACRRSARHEDPGAAGADPARGLVGRHPQPLRRPYTRGHRLHARRLRRGARRPQGGGRCRAGLGVPRGGADRAGVPQDRRVPHQAAGEARER